MRKRMIFLSFLACFVLSQISGLATITYLPDLYRCLYPNFCLDHTIQYPKECCPYSNSALEKEILSILSSKVYLIPAWNENCDFYFCKTCQTPVLRKTVYQGYEDDDDKPVFHVEYTCQCLGAWFALHEIEYYYNASLAFESWEKCLNQSVPYGYFGQHSRQFVDFLKQHLIYIEENPECSCYWPYLSELACSISDKVYERLYFLITHSFLEQLVYEEANSRDFPYLGDRSPYGALYGLFVHSFFYSHYREVLLRLASWEETHDPNTENVVAILNEIYSILDTIQPEFLKLYSSCLQQHPHPKIYYEKGMILFHQGDVLDALEDIQTLIDLAKKLHLEDFLTSDLYLKEGECYAELGLYDRAVEALTQALQKDPTNQQAYLERASAYFELGNFDVSLADYLQSGAQHKSLLTQENLAFGLELTKGILEGGALAGKEFFPMLLSSLHGLSNALWAFAQDPINISNEFIDALQGCVQFIKEHTPQETLCELVPELQTLVSQWDDLESSMRANQMGHLVGKYGIELFAGSGIAKGVSFYRKLKQANNLLTFEAMALSQRNRTLIQLEAQHRATTRKEILKTANLKIQQDKQGKHLIGHRNYVPIENKSIWTHPHPQKLVEKYAGTGFHSGTRIPGTPGYVEIVNFEEFIGYDVNPFTGAQEATTWGKIHYAQDGVHLVPTKPLR